MKKITLVILLAACGGLLAACGGDTKATPDAPVISAPDAAIDATQPATCFSGTPTTHDQLINACVNEAVVTRIIKMPVLPLLNPDGSLPQLP